MYVREPIWSETGDRGGLQSSNRVSNMKDVMYTKASRTDPE